MKVLILGGTRFFGKSVVRHFHETGADITLFTRGQRSRVDLPPHKHIQGDRTNVADLANCREQGPWDIVFDNLAYTANDVSLLVDNLKPTGRYIVTSSVSVYRYIPRTSMGYFREEDVDFGMFESAGNCSVFSTGKS